MVGIKILIIDNMYRYLCYILGMLLVASCSNEDNSTPDDEGKQKVNISVFAENGTIDNDIKAGLYMVNYINGYVDELLPAGNYINNQLIVYRNNRWESLEPIYWYDESTPADFYVYAPYKEDVKDACALQFAVETDQTTKENMAKSDFLWGAILREYPSANSFELKMQHNFSKLTVVITTDEAFDNFSADNISVAIGGTKTLSGINLQTGEITAMGDAQDVICHNNGDLSYTAILVPQQIPFSDFIKIDWNGSPYTLQSAFKLESKREYKLTIKLKKTTGGFDIGIDGWDIIDEDFGGIVGGV